MAEISHGFTLVPDAIVHECGPMAALVWGVVWRYCQMSGGLCWASQSTIGRRLGLSREAVRRHLRRLVEAGYLDDLTPDPLPGRPHTYADTGRARVGAADRPADRLEDQPSDQAETPLPPANEPGTTRDHPSQPPAKELGTPCQETLHPPAKRFGTPRQETWHPPANKVGTKKDSKTESKKDVQETEQDTGGVPPRAGGDQDYPDDFDHLDEGRDEDLLAEYFCRLTGIAIPVPRNDRQRREARVLWSAPLRRIAALCGSAAVGKRVIAAALAALRAKGCIVKAPISILGTAEALAGREAARRRSFERVNERFARAKRERRR